MVPPGYFWLGWGRLGVGGAGGGDLDFRAEKKLVPPEVIESAP